MMRRARWNLLAARMAIIVAWCCAPAASDQYPANHVANLQVPGYTAPGQLPAPTYSALPSSPASTSSELAPDFTPWWQEPLLHQLKRDSSPLTVTLDNAVLGTLM